MTSLTVFGDSLMKGVVLDSARNRYIQLKSCFVNLFSGINHYKVLNFASFGCTVTKGLSIVEKHLDTIPDTDYVVVEFGGNDCNFDWARISDSPNGDHLPVTPIDRFQDIYIELVSRIQSGGKNPFLLNLPPLDAGLFFRWISKGLNADNILKWLGDEDHTRRWHGTYSKAVEAIASIKNVPLIDIRTPFEKLSDYSPYLCEDGMHPNEKGHALINEVVANYRLAYI